MLFRNSGITRNQSHETYQEIQKKINQCDEELCFYQMFLDDARSRRDFTEISYFRQEMLANRREKRRLLCMIGGGRRCM